MCTAWGWPNDPIPNTKKKESAASGVSLPNGDRNAGSAGITARSTTMSSYYALVLTGGGAAQLQRVANGTVTVLGSAAVGVTTGGVLKTSEASMRK